MFGWKASEESCCEPLVEAVVLTDKFFMFRIFLLGESPRFSPGRLAKAVEGLFACSTLLHSEFLAMPKVGPKVERGAPDSGDSGEELGEGSVRDESMVDIVVVGEESVDSKVDAESLLNVGEEL